MLTYCIVENCIRKLKRLTDRNNTIPFQIERTCPHIESLLNDCPEQIEYEKRIKTQIKESAILITKEGKTFEIANVKGPRDSFFKQHFLDIVPAKKIARQHSIATG